MFWYALGTHEIFSPGNQAGMNHYLYLLINLCSVVVPFFFSFHPKLRFDRHFKTYFPANLIAALIFIIWDSTFTANGVWGFSNYYTIGWRIAGLPVEEILFFICIPFACTYTFHCLSIFFSLRWKQGAFNIFLPVICLFLLSVGLMNIDRAYTSVTFISTAFFLSFLHYIMKVQWLEKFFTVWLPLQIPFLIVNGLLTGTGLQEPVVWYNNEENLGIRLLTIPIEDTVYGFELMILTLFFFEMFKSRTKNTANVTAA